MLEILYLTKKKKEAISISAAPNFLTQAVETKRKVIRGSVCAWIYFFFLSQLCECKKAGVHKEDDRKKMR